MSLEAYFDGPDNYENKFTFHVKGGSPGLLDKLIAYIEERTDDIIEITLCWYLYNNNILHNYFKALASRGIKINVVTIPLEGYDHNNPKQVESENGVRSKGAFTKYDLARKIFAEVYHFTNFSNYKIFFFPHLYVRSSRIRKFSRGNLPYSLHSKTIYIKKKNGYCYLLSSSNMAVRDLVKFESLICIEDEPGYENIVDSFVNDLVSNSINIKDFDKSKNINQNQYDFIETIKSDHAFFCAPFYFDSAEKMESNIISVIQRARERIIICAQHLAAIDYRVDNTFHSLKDAIETRRGIIGHIVDKSLEGISLTCISQTFAFPSSDALKFANSRFRSPANKTSFIDFYNSLKKLDNVSYYVNENIHSKFIIIDNILVICTYNFTPTQFIFLDDVKIEKFIHLPNINYDGIHCEVGSHVILEDNEILKQYLAFCQRIVDHHETVEVL